MRNNYGIRIFIIAAGLLILSDTSFSSEEGDCQHIDEIATSQAVDHASHFKDDFPPAWFFLQSAKHSQDQNEDRKTWFNIARACFHMGKVHSRADEWMQCVIDGEIDLGDSLMALRGFKDKASQHYASIIAFCEKPSVENLSEVARGANEIYLTFGWEGGTSSAGN